MSNTEFVIEKTEKINIFYYAYWNSKKELVFKSENYESNKCKIYGFNIMVINKKNNICTKFEKNSTFDSSQLDVNQFSIFMYAEFIKIGIDHRSYNTTLSNTFLNIPIMITNGIYSQKLAEFKVNYITEDLMSFCSNYDDNRSYNIHLYFNDNKVAILNKEINMDKLFDIIINLCYSEGLQQLLYDSALKLDDEYREKNSQMFNINNYPSKIKKIFGFK